MRCFCKINSVSIEAQEAKEPANNSIGRKPKPLPPIAGFASMITLLFASLLNSSTKGVSIRFKFNFMLSVIYVQPMRKGQFQQMHLPII